MEPRPVTRLFLNWPNIVCTLPAGHYGQHVAISASSTWEWPKDTEISDGAQTRNVELTDGMVSLQIRSATSFYLTVVEDGGETARVVLSIDEARLMLGAFNPLVFTEQKEAQ
jgi:hypothetical protein